MQVGLIWVLTVTGGLCVDICEFCIHFKGKCGLCIGTWVSVGLQVGLVCRLLHFCLKVGPMSPPWLFQGGIF